MSSPTPERKKTHEMKRSAHSKLFKDATPEELRFRRWAVQQRIKKAKAKAAKRRREYK